MLRITRWLRLKATSFPLLLFVLLTTGALVLTSCSKDEDSPASETVVPPKADDSGKDGGNDSGKEEGNPDDNTDPGDEPDPGDSPDPGVNPGECSQKAYFTGEVRYPKYPLLRNLNFVYPSKGPFGEDVMLSGTITMRSTMQPQDKARGIILYNHYTVCRADECPSRGKLDMQNILYLTAPYRNFITVSADYYGFGETEDKMQAYCMASVNARASIDALIAARQLLAAEGYTWDDELLNVGYSQGGQTAIGVLKLATEEYPDLHFRRTLAGGGPYDLEETYRQYLSDGAAKLPSAVVSILMAYNEYFRLGIANDQLFRGSTLDHLQDWWLSKRYSSTSIDLRMGTRDITQFIAPPLLDLDSHVSRSMMNALASESLCQGWTPRKDEDIFLLHHNADDISPSENTQLLYDFLKAQGVERVEMQKADFLTLGISEHISGAVAFLTLVGVWIRNNYPVIN